MIIKKIKRRQIKLEKGKNNLRKMLEAPKFIRNFKVQIKT